MAVAGCNLELLLVTASLLLSSLDESLLFSQLPPAVVRVVAGSDTIELTVLTAADIELPAAETLVTSSDVIRESSEGGAGERRFSGN